MQPGKDTALNQGLLGVNGVERRTSLAVLISICALP